MTNINIADFTVGHYKDLLLLARKSYEFVRYGTAIGERKVVFWRHDCDISLNRALRVAQIENDNSVRSTFFLNPHAEFYNLFEKSQTRIIKQIMSYGHDIGLHFDAAFYDLSSEDQLSDLVRKEASWLESAFGVPISAFSFHNPTDFLLTCEKETYGGLINCYSSYFKKVAGYCSDSNGYWRFKRLHDVLEGAESAVLQILTHPEWWQEEPMYPRERIFRSIYGRAKASMDFYDAGLAASARVNYSGHSDHLQFLKQYLPEEHSLCEFLWNSARYDTLLAELCRIHKGQLDGISELALSSPFDIPALRDIYKAACELLDSPVGDSRRDVNGQLRQKCNDLCGVIREIAEWAHGDPEIKWDGFSAVNTVRFK